MNEVTDTGIILDLRAHGENHAIANILSARQGRIAGLVHGGQGRRQQPNVQPGNLVNFTWRARMSQQLGTFTLELTHNPSAGVMHDSARLSALQFLSPLLARVLPEHHPYPNLYARYEAFLRAINTPDWAQQYVMLEVRLLAELGYGLDFTRCAMTQNTDTTQLAFVSPKTGRAATADAARGYERQLFALPKFMVSNAAATMDCIASGLMLTGYFLEQSLADFHSKNLWQFRVRMLQNFQRMAAAA
ncbi:MAG TPA: DNA repair protein RecO [Alphaproteobacteria bacterium]|nr:DNA repair protein RecO [Rhodospirillaceae bacterium]HRJ12105.1 DNA repair protein RecO [Alphaproteobacteria bacterium]